MTISEGSRPAATESVEPPWDDRLRPGDGRSAAVTSGGRPGTIGQLASRYGWVALLIVASCVVNVLTAIQHTSGGTSNLRGPILDESTSALVLIMLLPILKRSVDAFSSARDRRVAFTFVAMAAVAYAVLHVTLIVLLRQLAYPAFGGPYEFHWRAEFATEVRKDLISAFMIVVVFWLIVRRPGARSVATADELPASPPRGSLSLRPEIWLRDGSASIRVDPTELISVTSAGNYVEFVLPDRRHFVRGTLAAEEIRLKPFGFSRVHRTRLVNSSRIAVIEPRPNGDFALRMDNGEVIAGSRRYKDAVVAIRATGRHEQKE
jgi:DNA-binding LytR/AlgR family response regulator